MTAIVRISGELGIEILRSIRGLDCEFTVSDTGLVIRGRNETGEYIEHCPNVIISLVHNPDTTFLRFQWWCEDQDTVMSIPIESEDGVLWYIVEGSGFSPT